MITHEFVLCSNIPDKICYLDYSGKTMVAISDDFILENHISIKKVKMYCQYIGNDIVGLAYHGITIITPVMAVELRARLMDYCKPSKDLDMLVEILDESISTRNYIIHFGV